MTAPQPFPGVRKKRKERYRLLKLVGQGGSGAVYKAEDLELDRIIAVKLLHPTLAGDERFVDLLKREVVVASQITHPNVVRVFDVSHLRNSPIITMAFIQGESLASVLHRDGALSTPRIIHFGRQICSALEAAHRQGVVHRDLKPQNLLVDHQSDIYISDFGLSHASSAGNHEAIQSSSRPGSLRYMSPEQFHALPCDQRSDIFSFGLVLHEMLTGTALDVDHDTSDKIAIDRKTGLPVTFPEGVSVPLVAIALRCLAQNPAERYQSASEILAGFPRDLFAADLGAADNAAIKIFPRAPGSRWTSVREHFPARLGAIIALIVLAGAGTWGVWYSGGFSPAVSFDELYRDASLNLQNAEDARALQKAATLFRSAAILKPTEAVFEGIAKAELRLYQLEADRRSLSDARSAVKRMEQLNGKSRAAALLHAEIEIADGEPGSAVSRLNHIVESEGASDEVLRSLAKAQFLTGHSAEALHTWELAIKLNPNYWPNHNGYGAVLMKLGRPEDAQAEFRKVIQLNPDSHLGYSNLGAAYIAAGDFAKAIAVTNKSLTIRATAQQYNNLGTALYYTGSLHAAIEVFLKAVELNPHSELYETNLGGAYGSAAQTDKANEAYAKAVLLGQDALRGSPGNAKLMARLALSLAKTGHMDEARHRLRLAVAAAPGNPEILYSKAQYAVIQHQYAEGAAAVKEALDKGYSIKLAARDPEIKPLWTDADLAKRFQAELKRGLGALQTTSW